jgi:hypothetical protein
MDVGVPWAVMRKGLTPWISEQVAKQANPTGFSPSRRRFLKGTGAAAAGTATGIPMLKQVAKQVPDFFAGLTTNVSNVLKNVSSVSGLSAQYGAKFEPTLKVLTDVLVGGRNKGHAVEEFKGRDITDALDNIDEVVEKAKSNLKLISTPDRPLSPSDGPWDVSLWEYVDDIYPRMIDIEHASDFYKSNPKGFISSLEDQVKRYEDLIKSSKEPAGVPKHILERGGPAEYFDRVMDQMVTYDPMRIREYEQNLKAAKDLLKELR